MDDLLSDFLTETAEHIEGIESHLVLFERNPTDPGAVTQIFRLVHTIKGTCGFLGLDRLQSIAHAAETLIDTLRNGVPPTALAVSLLLQSMDRIKFLLAQIGETGEPPGSDEDISGPIASYLRGELTGHAASSDAAGSQRSDLDGLKPSFIKAKPGSRAKRTGARKNAILNATADVAAVDQPGISPAPTAEAGPAVKEIEQPSAKAADTIRISVATIQRMMDLVSELVLTRNQIMQISRSHNISQIKTPLERLSTVASDLQDAVMQARMQPMARLFASVPRLIRELSVELHKKYNLVIHGADTELDRQLIEAIRDPLTHLIRNCCDHGIESPADRLAAGKPEAGRISISSFYESGHVHIEIADDGRGLDAGRIREKALERGLATVGAIGQMSDEDIYRFILEPGFTTAQAVTKVSGRGVGMDVVRSNIEAIGGTISLRSTRGRGSKFILKIPLTLAIAPALIVKVGAQRFALPQQCVVEAVNVEAGARSLQAIQNALVFDLRDELIPVARLAGILNLEPSGASEDNLIIVLGSHGKRFGVIVDEILDIQEIVVKPLGPLLAGLKLFSGNTILGDGSVILIIDPAGIAGALNFEKSAELTAAKRDAQDTAIAFSDLLLFKAGSAAIKAVPRSAVTRIVRAQARTFFQADGRYLYRYQEKLIPVVSAGSVHQESGSCLILIIAFQDRTFGLWIDEVLDIVQGTNEIQIASSSPELIGTMDLRGVPAEYIDAGYYYRLAYRDAHRPPASPVKLLIVDSERGVHDVLCASLAAAGYAATAVATAEEANELLQLTDYGLILLDSECAAQLDQEALKRQPNTLCLVFEDSIGQTGAGEPGGRDRVSRFDRHSLFSTIAQHLEKGQASSPNAANLNSVLVANIANSG